MNNQNNKSDDESGECGPVEARNGYQNLEAKLSVKGRTWVREKLLALAVNFPSLHLPSSDLDGERI
jgi:hypothetical protein